MLSSRTLLALALLAALPMASHAATKARAPKSHSVALGGVRHEAYSAEGDPAGALPGEKELSVRPLVVDGQVKDWTTGDLHLVTERSFTVRRALRVNDSLPSDKTVQWVWQRGPWLLVDRQTGKVTVLRLPDFQSGVSDVVWFRDYAAYCGLNATHKELIAVVAQIAVRKPLLAKKLAAWSPAVPACAPAVWQRQPLQVSFQPAGVSTPASFTLAGASAVLVEDNDSE